MSSDGLAVAALLISILSPLIAWYQIRLDRPRIKATARLEYHASRATVDDRISVIIVNAGRRSVILRLVGGTDYDGHWAGKFIEREKGGVRLGEQERFEWCLKWDDTCDSTWLNPEMEYVYLWVEDSLGRRHRIPGSAEAIKEMRKRGKPQVADTPLQLASE